MTLRRHQWHPAFPLDDRASLHQGKEVLDWAHNMLGLAVQDTARYRRDRRLHQRGAMERQAQVAVQQEVRNAGLTTSFVRCLPWLKSWTPRAWNWFAVLWTKGAQTFDMQPDASPMVGRSASSSSSQQQQQQQQQPTAVAVCCWLLHSLANDISSSSHHVQLHCELLIGHSV